MDTIDITPSPRVLRMLGEIDFKAWQCLCEIIDNSIDAFQDDSADSQQNLNKISIKLPSTSSNNIGPNDALVIEDNAKGMTLEELSRSLKAGFSGNNPVDKMGLFGMGFNISTARLGGRTEIVTTTADSSHFLKVVIDFKELENNKHFNVPVQKIQKKADEMGTQGTEVKISRLRVDHVKPLYRRKFIVGKLGKIYGRVIRKRNIKFIYAGMNCKPFVHCVWSETRKGSARGEAVSARINIDHPLDEKKYCSTCWVWLSHVDESCPSCGDVSAVTTRKRHVRGWIGIQRYFHANHYGIDLIRNGRVIRELDKSFFYWVNRDEDEEEELEYPIDGHGREGRIVGELEIDFVKVTHQKDAFDTSSVDWKEVVSLVRGDGPIRPNIAKSKGYPPNDSPLATLFSAFRNAKAGIDNLVPKRAGGGAMITDQIIDDMVTKFYDGEDAYQSDDKWWELLTKGQKQKPKEKEVDDGTGGNPFDDDEEEADDGVDDDNDSTNGNADSENQVILTEPDTELSANYILDFYPGSFVRVIAEKALDGEKETGFVVNQKGNLLYFTYWPKSQIYANSLLKPADFLINELAFIFHLNTQNILSEIPISKIELALRDKYFPDLHPNVEEVNRQVHVLNDELTEHLSESIAKLENFDSSIIPAPQLSEIKVKLAQNHYLDKQAVELAIEKGEFLSHAPFSVIALIINNYPQTVFDGEFLSKTLDGESDDELSMVMKEDLRTILSDVEWFLGNHVAKNSPLWRGRVKRLIGSLEILESWRA